MATPEKCLKCHEIFLEDSDSLTCTKQCKGKFHYYCVGFSEKSFRKTRQTKEKLTNWACIQCLTESEPTKNVNKDNSDANISSEASAALNTAITSDLPLSIQSVITDLFQDLKQESMLLREFINKKFADYEKSLQFNMELSENVSKSVKELNLQLQTTVSKQNSLEKENELLKSEMHQLKTDLVELQQYSRRMNVEITDYPEAEKENLNHVFSSFCTCLDLKLENNVSVIHRIPTSNKDKPRPIIIQFDNKPNRDLFLKAARIKKLTANDLNSRFVNNPIFVSEHLTKELKKVFYHSRQFKTQNNFKYCWVRDGKIFLRQNESSKVHRIVSTVDLLNVLPQ